MKASIITLFIFFALNYDIYCQIDSLPKFHMEIEEQISSNKENGVRSGYFYVSTGILEGAAIGIGKQISENFALAILGNATFIGGGSGMAPNGGRGLGIKLTYYKRFLIFNNFYSEYSSYLDLGSTDKINSLTKGHYIDIGLGKEKIMGHGFNFFWSVGINISAAKHTYTLYSPSLKVGLNFNLLKKEGQNEKIINNYFYYFTHE